MNNQQRIFISRRRRQSTVGLGTKVSTGSGLSDIAGATHGAVGHHAWNKGFWLTVAFKFTRIDCAGANRTEQGYLNGPGYMNPVWTGLPKDVTMRSHRIVGSYGQHNGGAGVSDVRRADGVVFSGESFKFRSHGNAK